MADEYPVSEVRKSLLSLADRSPGTAIGEITFRRTVAAALLQLLPPVQPGWHSVPDREPIDGGWTAGGDRITVDKANPGRLWINDPGLQVTWSATAAEVREYAAALLSAAARAEQAEQAADSD